ncbi:MBL fold metallo-hydrolase [Histidinibacterium aquaticum]|uniref:MBL fold metallo-hydrolase n=1 Tax=Histidinibacterium aquaticum TaxID=2613962 RepID=A0A5J5GRC4_9RHOB|nr:MBL fold metallo-hydrolase [Histidinibacterium aquaticum]KAA9010074.1 MBL fold metallo-hydrolase [Histidinibacterium aquaticum]
MPDPSPAHLPRFRDFRLGDWKVTTLLAGSPRREDPHSIFGLNVDAETFAAASRAAFLPTDWAQFFFTPTLVDTGSERVLFDTGLKAEGLVAALSAAGYGTGDITHVVLTHLHGDHIGGLTDESGEETFPQAQYLTGAVEYDAWSKRDSEAFESKVRPLAERIRFLDDGDAVLSGITAEAAFGHTPGHMTFQLESDSRRLYLFADVANHPVYSLAHPDWEVTFDMDKTQAAATRRRVLSQLADDRVPMIGYHMPFPACGYVEREGDGFRYVPHLYQLMPG